MPNFIYILFVLSTFVLMVVMLNMLIAVISDTYDMVRGMKKAGIFYYFLLQIKKKLIVTYVFASKVYYQNFFFIF